MTSSKAQLEKQAAELSAREILVETNDGTYSAAEAQRATGTGLPESNTYRVYAIVGGGTRHDGCAKDRAPGRGRALNRTELAAAQKQLAEIRRQIRAAK